MSWVMNVLAENDSWKNWIPKLDGLLCVNLGYGPPHGLKFLCITSNPNCDRQINIRSLFNTIQIVRCFWYQFMAEYNPKAGFKKKPKKIWHIFRPSNSENQAKLIFH